MQRVSTSTVSPPVDSLPWSRRLEPLSQRIREGKAKVKESITPSKRQPAVHQRPTRLYTFD